MHFHLEKPCVGEPNFRCVLIQSNVCRGSHNVEYHLQVIYNHALADGTSGMIITNEILSLYDQALEHSDVLKAEINALIEKTWEETIKSDIPDGTQNYEVIDLGLFEVKKQETLNYDYFRKFKMK